MFYDSVFLSFCVCVVDSCGSISVHNKVCFFFFNNFVFAFLFALCSWNQKNSLRYILVMLCTGKKKLIYISVKYFHVTQACLSLSFFLFFNKMKTKIKLYFSIIIIIKKSYLHEYLFVKFPT